MTAESGCNVGNSRTAVVLSGGGATGAYETGVLKALCGGKSNATGFQPLDPDIFSGTSIGSFNSAVMVSHGGESARRAVERLEDIWLNTIPRDGSADHNHVFRFRADPLEFLSAEVTRNPLLPMGALAGDAAFLARNLLNRGVQFFRSKESVERRALEMVDISTLISNEPEVRLIDATIDPGKVLQSSTILKLAATNWDTGCLTVFTNRPEADSGETGMPEENVAMAVLASTAIPGIFPAVEIDGAHYVDGGVVMNTPLTPAVRAGAATLHLIYLDPYVADIPLGALQSTIDVMSRLMVIQFAAKMNADIEAARRVNRELAAVERFRQCRPAAENAGAPSAEDELLADFLKVGNRKCQKLTIHRYHPHDDVSGVLGMLNFNRHRIAGLIERGYKDAVEHDCRVSQCIMPDGSYAS